MMSVLWTQQFNCFWKREKKKKIPRNAQIDRLYARALERKNCPKAYKKENTGEKNPPISILDVVADYKILI